MEGGRDGRTWTVAYRDTETHLKTCRYTHNLQGRYCHFPCHEYFQLHPGREFVSRPPPVKLYVHLLCVPLSLAHTHTTHTQTHTHKHAHTHKHRLSILPLDFRAPRQILVQSRIAPIAVCHVCNGLGVAFDLDSGGVRSVNPVKLLCPQSFWCAQCENGIFVFDGVRSIAAFGGNNFKSASSEGEDGFRKL